ncbi:MAG TPA: protein phosphatase CheZ [Holophaga sp.]|nr:protein phosphatase CheZ [Holophaga sp.]HPS67002.1 protein phosphatase CheZ [Holophaga sp.]
MDSLEPSAPQIQPLSEPESLLKEFRERGEAVDARLDKLQELFQELRSEIQNEARQSLVRLAQVAQDMAEGKVYQEIDIQAKGEIGDLVRSLNQTLQNLQQLDSSVKQQSTQVPELAAQLDAITADTEQATQVVMNRLDTLMNASEEAHRALTGAAVALQAAQEDQIRFQDRIDQFLSRASGGENPALVAQEVLDFLFEYQMNSRRAPVDLDVPLAHLAKITDESFEILNTLQFQDITRQKVEKVILLLKHFREGLDRLLAIFNIQPEEHPGEPEVFENRMAATQDHIFETSLHADEKKESVEDIIAQFKKGQN